MFFLEEEAPEDVGEQVSTFCFSSWCGDGYIVGFFLFCDEAPFCGEPRVEGTQADMTMISDVVG